MKIIKKGTVVRFLCGSCGSEFVAGIKVVETPDKGENYSVYCPVCGTECHADCNAVNGSVDSKKE